MYGLFGHCFGSVLITVLPNFSMRKACFSSSFALAAILVRGDSSQRTFQLDFLSDLMPRASLFL